MTPPGPILPRGDFYGLGGRETTGRLPARQNSLRKPIGISLPDQVTLTITEADPVVKGQTAASSYKPAMLENGIRVLVPPFISSGERIVVDTNEITYLRRAD